MGKGDATRSAILDRGARLASEVGLSGLTIGRLARDLRLSKSGLFAHFRSKEALQVQVLEAAAERFVDTVVRPALAAPRGQRRLRALFDRWLAWSGASELPGGCLFVAAAVELDDRPGPVRERLVALQREWLDVIARVAAGAVTQGEFRRDIDPEQLAHEIYGIMLGHHHASRLLRQPRAEAMTRTAFEALLERARVRRSRTGTAG